MMEMTLKEAVERRHSVRRYKDEALTQDDIARLGAVIETCNRDGGLHLQLVTDEPKAFGSRWAKYGKFAGVRNYIAVVGPKGRDITAGYYGERVVLEAQRMGLNTCWVGLTYGNYPEFYTVNEGEKLYVVIAIGRGETQGVAHPQKKGIEHYARWTGEMPEWFRQGMEAALKAPTAINQQKFEFELVGERRVKASYKKALLNGYPKIDLGIVMCHFEIGAGEGTFEWETSLIGNA